MPEHACVLKSFFYPPIFSVPSPGVEYLDDSCANVHTPTVSTNDSSSTTENLVRIDAEQVAGRGRPCNCTKRGLPGEFYIDPIDGS
jgi:hypothetical protein